MKVVAAKIALVPLLLFSYFLSLLSPRIIGVLGRGLGLFLRSVGFRKKVVEGNIQLALHQELSLAEQRQLARDVYANVGILFLEIARNFSFSKKQSQRELHISAETMARIQAGLRDGKGMICISAHMANWELFAMGTAAWGIPVSIVAKRMNGLISQVLIERQRLRTELEIIYSGGALEQMKKHLARGRAIGFMVDQNITGQRGIRANFFGVPAASIRGLAKLVKEIRCNVVPICAFRLPDGKHEVIALDPLPYLEAPELPEGSPERWAREEFLNTQQYQEAAERLVRRQKDQWMWIHRRWKTNRAPLNLATAHLENVPPTP